MHLPVRRPSKVVLTLPLLRQTVVVQRSCFPLNVAIMHASAVAVILAAFPKVCRCLTDAEEHRNPTKSCARIQTRGLAPVRPINYSPVYCRRGCVKATAAFCGGYSRCCGPDRGSCGTPRRSPVTHWPEQDGGGVGSSTRDAGGGSACVGARGDGELVLSKHGHKHGARAAAARTAFAGPKVSLDDGGGGGERRYLGTFWCCICRSNGRGHVGVVGVVVVGVV